MSGKPTPWRVHPTDSTRIIAADGADIATIEGDYDDADAWPEMEAAARKMEAAARKMAAAPEMYEAGQKLNDLIAHAQAVLGAHIQPDGMSEHDALSILIELFDSGDQREAQAAWGAAIAKAEGRS